MALKRKQTLVGRTCAYCECNRKWLFTNIKVVTATLRGHACQVVKTYSFANGHETSQSSHCKLQVLVGLSVFEYQWWQLRIFGLILLYFLFLWTRTGQQIMIFKCLLSCIHFDPFVRSTGRATKLVPVRFKQSGILDPNVLPSSLWDFMSQPQRWRNFSTSCKCMTRYY